MTINKGSIAKMRTEVSDSDINYFLPIGTNEVHMNNLIGKEITLRYSGEIFCVKCGCKTYKSFSQGFCYPCFSTSPETEECILKPELCRAHEGIARDMEYAKKHCLTTQHVYISFTSGFKVGVTRHTQIPTRWVDQGATEAVIIANAPNRYTAGIIEVALKAYMADKTNWRKMLSSNDFPTDSILEKKEEIKKLLPIELQEFIVDELEPQKLIFPGEICNGKIGSYNFDKTPEINGVLKGIKGQYLIFEGNSVLNIRKFGGYFIECEY